MNALHPLPTYVLDSARAVPARASRALVVHAGLALRRATPALRRASKSSARLDRFGAGGAGRAAPRDRAARERSSPPTRAQSAAPALVPVHRRCVGRGARALVAARRDAPADARPDTDAPGRRLALASALDDRDRDQPGRGARAGDAAHARASGTRPFWRSPISANAQPLNGIVVCVTRTCSAQDGAWRRAATRLRQCVDEAAEHLRLHLPVYLVVTGLERSPACRTFCAALPSEALAQALGHRLPDNTDGARGLDDLFDPLILRLHALRMALLRSQPEPARRLAIHGFVEQFRALQPGLRTLAEHMFDGRPQPRRRWRGLYFTAAPVGRRRQRFRRRPVPALPAAGPAAGACVAERRGPLRRWRGSIADLARAEGHVNVSALPGSTARTSRQRARSRSR